MEPPWVEVYWWIINNYRLVEKMQSREATNTMWEKRWKNNDLPWDMPQGSPYVTQYFQDMVQGTVKGKRVLVPCCGATVEMFLLYKQKVAVVGVEFSEAAYVDMLGGLFDYCVDIGGLVSTAAEERQRYVAQVTKLLVPQGRVLLECFEYDMSLRKQPPYSIPTETLKQYLSDVYEIKELRRNTEDELPRKCIAHDKLIYNTVHVVYQLIRKSVCESKNAK
ncbi:thiopurine S-methyltransferase-like [Hydractinia symbiolongicarpus]|uniref:thiopurine S-methyltransferase-like n=1 Tax=Hydractinia symbiolongicarpus TaxID=13093 RepID=UPI00254D8FD5|nr:thiopurine S-methyltransferase-like [Hydractinia symbiolongicarpus]